MRQTDHISDEEIIRNALLLKYNEKRDKYFEVIYDFLQESRQWSESALRFTIPAGYKRKNIKSWNFESTYWYEFDSIISTNWRFNKETLEALLSIQPIDFWILYINARGYESAIKSLATFPRSERFIEEGLDLEFPAHELKRFVSKSEAIFKKIQEEKVIEKLANKKINLLLIANNEPFQQNYVINMMNVLLYSVLFEIDFIELTKLCVFTCHIMTIVSEGKDIDGNQAQQDILSAWNQNGNWNLIIGIYLKLFVEDKGTSGLLECYNKLVKERDFSIFPFKIKPLMIGDSREKNGEDMRTKINNVRIGKSLEPLL